MDEARHGPEIRGSEPGAGLAGKLRAAREAKGASIDAAHRATGVPLHYLTMFEEGRFPMVSDPAYLAPFMRRYAAYLGLDSEQALRDLITENEPETVARRAGKRVIVTERKFQPVESFVARRAVSSPASMPAARSIGNRRPLRLVYTAGVAVAALILAGGYVVLGRDGRGWLEARLSLPLHPGPAARSVPVPEPLPPRAAVEAPKVDAEPTAPSPRVEPQTAERPAAAVLAPEPPPSAAIQPRESAPEAPTAAPEPPARGEATGPSPPYELSLTATSRPVWVWISIDGGPRRSMLLDPGRSVKWVAQQGYLLSVDDAGAVRAVLNGTALAALGGESQARRNVVIPGPEVRSAYGDDAG
ncbi:MAG: helix-turn-helix domain-containing protein [Candidatus Binatia bacterium]